jgi:hypothetical protein
MYYMYNHKSLNYIVLVLTLYVFTRIRANTFHAQVDRLGKNTHLVDQHH